MIKHVVMWKFKQGKEVEMKRFLDALESLRGQIDVIRSTREDKYRLIFCFLQN